MLFRTKLPKGTARGSCVCRDCSTSPVHAPHRRALDIALPRRAGALPLVASTSKYLPLFTWMVKKIQISYPECYAVMVNYHRNRS